MTDKKLFDKYEKVRKSGKYNMITEADKAMKEAGLSPYDYYYVQRYYDMLSKKYGEKDDKTKND